VISGGGAVQPAPPLLEDNRFSSEEEKKMRAYSYADDPNDKEAFDKWLTESTNDLFGVMTDEDDDHPNRFFLTDAETLDREEREYADKHGRQDEEITEEWRLYDVCHQMFGCIAPNGHRLKDCTNAEMAGFERAWKKEEAVLNTLWDEVTAVLNDLSDKHYNEDYNEDSITLRNIVFHTLLTTLLSLARDKGASEKNAAALLLKAALALQ
jgi:hypothetical protein